jgi:hypothetical protein
VSSPRLKKDQIFCFLEAIFNCIRLKQSDGYAAANLMKKVEGIAKIVGETLNLPIDDFIYDFPSPSNPP